MYLSRLDIIRLLFEANFATEIFLKNERTNKKTGPDKSLECISQQDLKIKEMEEGELQR